MALRVPMPLNDGINQPIGQLINEPKYLIILLTGNDRLLISNRPKTIVRVIVTGIPNMGHQNQRMCPLRFKVVRLLQHSGRVVLEFVTFGV